MPTRRPSPTRGATTPISDLVVVLWQTPFRATPEQALRALDQSARRAAGRGAQLLVTPEMALTGYAIGARRVAALAQPADGPWAQAVAGIARAHGLAIVYGYPESNPQGRPYNAAQAIGPDGQRLGQYRKTHLYGDMDRRQFSPGDRAPAVFGCLGWRLGLLICYDVEFPEAVRGLALQGADAVLVPTANMVPFDEVQRVLLPARALENRLYLGYANACGAEGDLAYNGLSTWAAPDGQVPSRAGRRPALQVQRLSVRALQQARLSSQLADRRADLYRSPT
jgi:predicted amidohydrolase